MVSEKSSAKKTKCICPLCPEGKFHYMDIYWTGNGIPKKFCKNHEYRIDSIDNTFRYIDRASNYRTYKREKDKQE